jgi:hypothetical protein
MSPSRHILLLKPRDVYAVTKGVDRVVYEEVKTLDDLLGYALIASADNETVLVNGKPIPFRFEATFFFKNKSRAWRTTFNVRIDDDTPKLINLTIGGLDEYPFPEWVLTKWKNNEKLTQADGKRLVTYSDNRISEGVQRYQSDLVAKYQTQLFDRAVLMGFNYSAKKSNFSYTPKQLRELTKEIQATTRRKVTTELLKHVTRIYLRAETSFPKANPIEEIMNELKVSHRRAQEYAQYARAQGYLPTPKQIKRKVKKQTKKKG